MRRFVLPPVTAAFLVLAAAPAHAQITQRREAPPLESTARSPDFVVTDEKNGNYAVEFEKEAIDATLTDGSIPRIVVRPVHLFGQLARPRLHFVPELLKSIEFM